MTTTFPKSPDAPALPYSGEFLAGLMKHFSTPERLIKAAPTVTAGAYTASDCLGGVMELQGAALFSGRGGVLKAITATILDDGADLWVANDIEILLFDAAPGGVYTDNAALAATGFIDADAAKFIGAVLLDTKSALGNVVALSKVGLDLPYQCSGSPNLYAVAVNRGGRTPDATNAVRFTFHLLRT